MSLEKILEPKLLLRANAGSGKTFMLAHRYIALLNLNIDPSSILAITFTKKAAGEILERVFSILIAAARSEINAQNTGNIIGDVNFTAGKATVLLKKIIKNIDSLKISTIDSFYASIAKCFSWEFSLPVNWNYIEQKEQLDIFEKVLFEILSDNVELQHELLKRITLDDGVKNIYQYFLELINSSRDIFNLVSPDSWGNFKTNYELSSSEIERILNFNQHENITPKNKGGTTLNKNFLKALYNLDEIVKNKLWKKAIENTLLKNVLEENYIYYSSPIEEIYLERVFDVIKIIAHYAFLEVKKVSSAAKVFLMQFEIKMQEKFSSSGKLGFDDLKILLAKNLSAKNLIEVYYRLDSNIKHVLLDEFQDTSKLEWTILKPFIEEILAKPKQLFDSTFFCVGDSKQAIYGWRGGDKQLFSNLIGKYSNQLEVSSLNSNFRSHVNILNIVDTFFNKLLEVNFDSNKKNTVCSFLAEYKNHISSINSDNNSYFEFVEVIKTLESEIDNNCIEELSYEQDKYSADSADSEDSNEEGEFFKNNNLKQADLEKIYKNVADKIISIKNADIHKSIAVLFRGNKDIQTFRKFLNTINFPFNTSESGGNLLSEQYPVNLIILILKVIDNPALLIDVFQLEHLDSFMKCFSDFNDEQGEFNFAEIFSNLRKLYFEEGLPNLINYVCSKLMSINLTNPSLHVLQLLKQMALQFSSTELRLTKFINVLKNRKIENADKNSIHLITIHKSKGLEFDCVFLPQMHFDCLAVNSSVLVEKVSVEEASSLIVYGSKKFHREYNQEIKDLYLSEQLKNFEESLSLIYVAITRAKIALYVYKISDNQEEIDGAKKDKASRDKFETKIYADDLLYEVLSKNNLLISGNVNWYNESVGEIKNSVQGVLETFPIGNKNSDTVKFSFIKNSELSIKNSNNESKDKNDFRYLTELFNKVKAEKNNEKFISLGTAIHFILENIVWFENSSDYWISKNSTFNWSSFIKEYLVCLQITDRLFSEKNFISFENEILDILLSSKETLNRIFNKKVFELEYGTVIKVFNERPIVYLEDSEVVQGRIDRIVFYRSIDSDNEDIKVKIFDYKIAKESQNYSKKYKEQMNSYKKSVAKIYNIQESNIDCELVYLL